MSKANGRVVDEKFKNRTPMEVMQATYAEFHKMNDDGCVTARLVDRLYKDTLKAFNANAITVNECQRNCLEAITVNTGAYKGNDKEREKVIETIASIEKQIYPQNPYEQVNALNIHYVMATVGVNKNTRAEEIASLITNIKIAVSDKEIPVDVAQKHVEDISNAELEDGFAISLRAKLLEHQRSNFEKAGITVPVAKYTLQ